MHHWLVLILALMLTSLSARATDAPAAAVSYDELRNADYQRGRVVFLQRCSACHTLNDGGLALAGPNLWRLFERRVGSADGFQFSDALKGARFRWTPDQLNRWVSDPAGFLPGNRMLIPEAVPEPDRIPLLSFMMVETGAADWPRPELPATVDNSDLPLAERFPSFYNHLMTNTTRFRVVTPDGDLVFQAYFQEDGSITGSPESVRGFWHVDERSMFCFAMYGLPRAPNEFIQCFPIAAMAIPRFAEELWESKLTSGLTAYGGILPGRP